MKLFSYKLLLSISNLALSACGLVLLVSGFSLLVDSNRILISRLIGANSDTLLNLSHPFFYYIAFGLAAAGLILIFVSLIGCWATCLNNYCVLGIYFFSVLSLLLLESSFCSIAAVWPQCLGLNLDESLLVKILQSNYGIPGKEQLTASIDLVQTHFKCCAINSHLNYDMSLWRLQNYGQRDWVVPQTCCILTNDLEERSYLDPKPQNLTLCQSLLKHEHNRARHKDNCLEYLIDWYHHHYSLFLTTGGVIATVQCLVLASIIFSCTKIAHKRKRTICRSTGTTMQTNVLAHNVKRQAPQPQPQLRHHHQTMNEITKNTAPENITSIIRYVDPNVYYNSYLV